MTKIRPSLTLEEILEKLQGDLPRLRKRYGVESIAVYGSFAKGEQDEESDVDILVELAEPSALKFVNLAYHLENLIGRDVDLATFDTFRDRRDDLRYQHIAADIERALIDVEKARPKLPA
ncbi:MAG: hypothetical protein MAG451_01451 [Anaerolineales bacterium]|nr:hypothetical protein [Anaerolineales bacterium]